MKSYIIINSFLITAQCFAIYFFKPNYSIFTYLIFGIYFCVGFIDALAEGMTVIITKMVKFLKEIRPIQDIDEIEVSSDWNKKALGNYLVMRILVRMIFLFFGGLLSSKFQVDIGMIYAILGILPIPLAIYTIFFFHEDKVKYF